MRTYISPPDGWFPFGSFVNYDFDLEFMGEAEDGLPLWERPVLPNGKATQANPTPEYIHISKADFITLMRGLAIAIQASRLINNEDVSDMALDTYSRMFQRGAENGWLYLSGEVSEDEQQVL